MGNDSTLKRAEAGVSSLDPGEEIVPGKIVGAIGKSIDFLVTLGASIGGVGLLVCTLITCYEVFMRYVFLQPTHWTLDLSIYILIWFTFITAAYVQQQDRHVFVDLLISRLPQRTKLIWDVVTSASFLFFSVLFFYYCGKYTFMSYKYAEFSNTMWKVIMWPVKISLPLGGLLLILGLCKDLAIKVRTLVTTPLERGTGFLARPFALIALFFVVVLASLFLIKANGVLGMVLLMFVLLFAGIPIFPALGLVGVAGIFFIFGGTSALFASFPTTAYRSLDSFSLVCLPLYILVGQVIEAGGVGEEIYETASKWTAGVPGGEAVATILACSTFAAISTSSVATAATMGLIALPALELRKYNKAFSYGLLAAGGTLGIMIPPSGTMIIYSAVTDESLGKLFLAGVLPGAILATGFILYSIIYCKRTGFQEDRSSVSFGERLRAFRTGMWGLLAPVIIIGGIYSGIFTPLESGAVAVLYALVMVLCRRKVKPSQLLQILRHSSLNATMVLCIIVGALILGKLMTMMRLPNMALELVSSMALSRWGVLLAVVLMMTVLGMFLEVISVMMITLPVVYPIMIALHFDGIWFAVLVTLTMEMALLTPPVGLNLYVITGISKAPLAQVLRGVTPFFIIMVACLILYAIFPGLSTWLPNTLVAAK